MIPIVLQSFSVNIIKLQNFRYLRKYKKTSMPDLSRDIMIPEYSQITSLYPDCKQHIIPITGASHRDLKRTSGKTDYTDTPLPHHETSGTLTHMVAVVPCVET